MTSSGSSAADEHSVCVRFNVNFMSVKASQCPFTQGLKILEDEHVQSPGKTFTTPLAPPEGVMSHVRARLDVRRSCP